MIVILKHQPNPSQLEGLLNWLQEKGVSVHTSVGRSEERRVGKECS